MKICSLEELSDMINKLGTLEDYLFSIDILSYEGKKIIFEKLLGCLGINLYVNKNRQFLGSLYCDEDIKEIRKKWGDEVYFYILKEIDDVRKKYLEIKEKEDREEQQRCEEIKKYLTTND